MEIQTRGLSLMRIYTDYNFTMISNETAIWINGYDHIERWQSPLQKLRDQRVKDVYM